MPKRAPPGALFLCRLLLLRRHKDAAVGLEAELLRPGVPLGGKGVVPVGAGTGGIAAADEDHGRTVALAGGLQAPLEGVAGILLDYAAPHELVGQVELGFGIAFQLPILIFYLVIFNIVPYKKLRGSWRYVYVGLMIFAAMVTPDANPVTMLLMFAALIALYELSLLIARVVLARKIKKQNEELAAEEESEAV